MAGDVSARRYFRVDLGAGETAVLACYPDAILDDCSRFVRTTELLSLAGIRVPEILSWTGVVDRAESAEQEAGVADSLVAEAPVGPGTIPTADRDAIRDVGMTRSRV